MTEIERIRTANETYVDDNDIARLGAAPTRHLAIVTCMDARIDVFAALGLELGEAHVIRNAGGRVTEDVTRSLALSAHRLGVDTVVLMQHTSCGLEGLDNEELRQITGATDVEFLPIHDHEAALKEDAETIAQTPYLAPITRVAGFVFDVHTGQARLVF